MNYCPQCRTPLDAGARFCANCGHTLPAQAPPQPQGGPRPFAGAPGYAPPAAQPGYGPPPGAPPQYGAPPAAPPQYGSPPGPPGYGAAPPGPPGYGPTPVGGPPGYGAPGGMPPGAVPPPPPADDGGGMKVLGGCGVAGCLGAVFAVLMGVGLIIVLVMLGGSSSSSGGGSSSGPGGEVPSSGSVRSLIRPQVGAYRLVGTSPLEKVPPGVVDSIGAVYVGPSGNKVIHVLLVYPSDTIAADRIQAVWSSSMSSLKPGQKISRGNVTDNTGAVRGTIVSVTGGNPESFYWSNRKLVVIVEGPPPDAKGFESSAPY